MFGRAAPEGHPVVRHHVVQYAARMHRLLGRDHGVCSPLGAWLLLALVADGASGADRTSLTDVLGCDPAAARTSALELLRNPPPDVAAAAACWADPAVTGPGYAALVAAISPPADTGPVPTQQQADRWAADRTLGLIDRFPIAVGGDPVALVLASALATRISWRAPYDPALPTDLVRPVGDPRFVGAQLLRAPATTTWTGIVDGRYAAHCAQSPGQLLVVSLIGGPDDDPAELLAVAGRTAVARARDEDVPGETSLFDLDLGDGPAWRITEASASGRRERFETVLPAWAASSRHDLMTDPQLGFGAAGRAVAALLAAPDLVPDAVQAAVARYTRTGFEAAAVTAMAMRSASMSGSTRPVRTARVEFTHPYVVVAATGGDGPWRGLPVFSARVAEPALRDGEATALV